MSALTKPQIVGAAVVGQRLSLVNGTYSSPPDSYSELWAVAGSSIPEQTSESILVLDIYAGSTLTVDETAHKAGYADSTPVNTSLPSPTVTNIDLTNAIISLTRTSSSGTLPMTSDIRFGSNVFAGYVCDRVVYTDSARTIYKSTNLQDSTASHTLTQDDLLPGATIDWSRDGGPSIAATDWVEYRIRTTSPNGLGYLFIFGTAISPTDAVIAMAWNTGDAAAGISVAGGGLDVTASSGVYGMIRSNRSKSTGKWYAEYKILNTGNLTQVGWANATASLNNFLGSDTNGVSFFNNGQFFYNGSNVGSLSGLWATNDIIQVCGDFDNHLAWFGRNNTFTGNPAAGTGGISIPNITTAFAAFDAKAGEVLAQWLSASQTYTPPTGFTAIG